MKWVVAIVLIAVPAKFVCVKWAWTGDVFERRVYCLEWKKVEQ